jgi:thymidylate synthase (FAD)
MADLVQPRTFLVGATGLDTCGVADYLAYTDNQDFGLSASAALMDKCADGEVLASMAAKVCYKSLTLGKNSNVTRVRDIPSNIKACIDAGHGSVFGHVVVNFITTNCSRVFTHELIRHEIGTEVDVPALPLGLHEWSQTSGRYVRIDELSVVWDKILDGCEDIALDHIRATEELIYLLECRKGLRVPNPKQPEATAEEYYFRRAAISQDPAGVEDYKWVPNNKMPFDVKKKITSAIRRFALNGQSNEIFWSANLRSLRHMLQMRTAPGAEYEIRLVFGQVFELLRKKFKHIFADAQVTMVDGLPHVHGMKTQPYQSDSEPTLGVATGQATQPKEEACKASCETGPQESTQPTAPSTPVSVGR